MAKAVQGTGIGSGRQLAMLTAPAVIFTGAMIPSKVAHPAW